MSPQRRTTSRKPARGTKVVKGPRRTARAVRNVTKTPRRAINPVKVAKATPARKATEPASGRKAVAPRKRQAGTKPTLRPAVEPQRPAPLPLGKLRIAVFGAGGTIGSRVANEAAARGHAVTPVQRSPGFVKLGAHRVGVRRGDAMDAQSVARIAKGHDAVISAVSPPWEKPELLVRAARGLLAGCRAAEVPRLVIVNGAGSLTVDDRQLLDTPDFPKEWRPVSVAHRDALHYMRDAAAGVQWTAISPPALIQPGVRTGRYQLGTDRLLKGRDGQSRISVEDYAVAVVDEIEKGRFKGKRMTVAWP